MYSGIRVSHTQMYLLHIYIYIYIFKLKLTHTSEISKYLSNDNKVYLGFNFVMARFVQKETVKLKSQGS